jgi:hypothetical protein
MEAGHNRLTAGDERGRGVEILARLAPFSWTLAAAATLILSAYALPDGDRAPLKFTAVVLAACGLLWVFPFSGRRERRRLVSLFLLAFAIRVGSAVLFDSLGSVAGDPYGGSPDAWAYDQWAKKLVSAWSELRGFDLTAHDAAGRWDVGFHYLLAMFYGLVGPSLLAGRVLAGFFGALAVVFLYLVARRVADESVAVVAGLVYTFWVSSIVWSTHSVLRDSLIWALMLVAVWFALRVADGFAAAGFAFFFALLFLRTVRAYAASLILVGLAVAGALAVLRRDRKALRPALIIAAAVMAGEAVFIAAGYPNSVSMMTAYQPRRVLLKPMTEGESTTVPIGQLPIAAPPAKRTPEDAGKPRPRNLLPASVPANALRFFLSPPAWAPVRGGARNPDNWPVPGMWLWYAILPVSAIGFLVSFRGSRALRSLALTATLFSLLLILVSRGELARQREMVVPIFLLWFAIGLGPALRRPRLLLAVYLLYAAILGAGIVYHRGTLRDRGMVRVLTSPECPIPAGERDATVAIRSGLTRSSSAL